MSPAPTTDGSTRFARYAFPPNELGYCGPDGASLLLEHTTSGGGAIEVAGRAPRFDGAWVYLEVLAEAAGLDPLDPEVVDAYWVGNDLLSAVDPAGLLATLRERFQGQSGALLPQVESADVLAHHGFHVVAVYPWTGLLGRNGDIPRSVLDACRIRWGTVLSIGPERLDVASRPLTWDGGRLDLGEPRTESVRWSSSGLSLHAEPAAGDVVSMHWDWVCERLTDVQVDGLSTATSHAVDLANRMLPLAERL